MIIAVGTSRMSTQWKRTSISWPKLMERFAETVRTRETMAEYKDMPKDRKTNIKDVGGMVGGELSCEQRKNEFLLNRCILALDIDYGTTDTWEEMTTLCDWECFMHTTHSHTPDKPRYRMYFPLKRPVTKEEYAPLGRMVASMINIELFDDTTYEAARLMFWPSTCSDGEFKYWHQSGDWIDPDAVLSAYADWRDESSWPVSSRVTREIRKAHGNRQLDPRLKGGIIGAFCQVYTVPAAIDRYLPDVYVKSSEMPDRYTYTGGSTSNGLKIFDDGLFAESWHETDPAHGRLCNAFDLVRLHLYPNLDEKKSLSEMYIRLDKDEAVQKRYYEMLFTSNGMPFDDGFDEDQLRRDKMDLTETGNALRLKDKLGEFMCYNPSAKWCVWTGKIWELNAEDAAMHNVMWLNDIFREWSMKLCRDSKPEDVEKLKPKEYPIEYQQALKAYAWAEQSRNSSRIVNTLKLTRAAMKDADMDDFDADPWDLNTPIGIVNLKTGEVIPHAPGHRCTMITEVSPLFDAPHPRWDAFLDLVSCGNEDMIDFLQQVAGMSLVGQVYEEGLIICWGSGSNGKSTLFEIWLALMRQYGGSVRNEVLMGNRLGTEVAGANQLRGKRLVVASELENQQVMSNSLLKRLTSRDEISANVKFAEPITFKPTHTLVIHTNHLPRLKDVDYGTIRRIIVIPFNATISQDDKQNDFAENLVREEGPAILAWMIEGAIRFYNNGMKLKKPACIREASERYIEGEDLLNRFIRDCCEIVPDKGEYIGQLYVRFKTWCEEEGIHCSLGRNKFGDELISKKKLTKKSDNRGVKLMGIVLQDDEEI